jgi:hypothetical protein
MHFSPLSCYLVPLKSKYLPRHTTVKHAQPTFFPRNKGHPVLINKIKFVAHRKQSERVLQIPARDCCAWKQIQNAQSCVKPGGTYINITSITHMLMCPIQFRLSLLRKRTFEKFALRMYCRFRRCNGCKPRWGFGWGGGGVHLLQ